MPKDNHPAPRQYLGVMVSSTFTDLEQHRAALIKAIKGQGLTDVAMENDSAKPDVDVIDSSLQMVQDAAAYIGVISRKYGQTPLCPKRNPAKLSITELEFNEAQRLERPILLFIMGDNHPVREADVETNARQEKEAERVSRAGKTDEAGFASASCLCHVRQSGELHLKSHPRRRRASAAISMRRPKPLLPRCYPQRRPPRPPEPSPTQSPHLQPSTPSRPTSARTSSSVARPSSTL